MYLSQLCCPCFRWSEAALLRNFFATLYVQHTHPLSIALCLPSSERFEHAELVAFGQIALRRNRHVGLWVPPSPHTKRCKLAFLLDRPTLLLSVSSTDEIAPRFSVARCQPGQRHKQTFTIICSVALLSLSAPPSKPKRMSGSADQGRVKGSTSAPRWASGGMSAAAVPSIATAASSSTPCTLRPCAGQGRNPAQRHAPNRHLWQFVGPFFLNAPKVSRLPSPSIEPCTLSVGALTVGG